MLKLCNKKKKDIQLYFHRGCQHIASECHRMQGMKIFGVSHHDCIPERFVFLPSTLNPIREPQAHSQHGMSPTLLSVLISPAVGSWDMSHSPLTLWFSMIHLLGHYHFCTLNTWTMHGPNTIIKSIYWHENRHVSTPGGLLQLNSPRI